MGIKKNIVFDVLLKKWWLILIVGIIVSVGVTYEKTIKTSYVIKTGEIWYTKIIAIENYTVMNNDYEKFKYSIYMRNFSTIDRFIKETENEYDYNRFCLNWEKKTKLEKYKWVQSHIFINDFGAGVYELCFRLKDNDDKELYYVLINGEKYLEKYLNYSNTELKKINEEIKFKEISNFKVLPQEKIIEKTTIVRKYAIIGFVLGVLLSTVVLSLDSLRKEYVRK